MSSGSGLSVVGMQGRQRRREEGNIIIQYVLIVALCVLVGAAAMSDVGSHETAVFSNVADGLAGGASHRTPPPSATPSPTPTPTATPIPTPSPPPSTLGTPAQGFLDRGAA